MIGFAAMAGKELREQWRTRRLPVVALVFLFVGLSSPLLARFTPELIESLAGDEFPFPIPPPTVADSVDQLLKNLIQFGGLAGILLAMGAVAPEKERGTAALLLTTPLSRPAFLAAKVLALGTTLTIGVAAAMASGWLYTAILFEPLPVAGFLAAGALVWLLLAAFTALTFLGSVVTGSAVAAGALGFGLFLVLSLLSAFPVVGEYLPSGLIAPAMNVALGSPGGEVIRPLLATVLLIGGALVVSHISFRRQEL
jgi:ABC-2 type transport system permease protein